MEPNERWRNFLDRDDGNRVGIARFLSIRNADLNRAWFDASRHWIEDVGGQRIYAGELDAVSGRAALSFEQLVIEEYPSRQAAVEVMSRSDSELGMGLRDSFVLALAPESRLSHRIVALIGKAVKALGPVRITEVPEVQYPKDIGGLNQSSDEAQLAVFHRSNQWQPFTMVNLNLLRPQAPDSEKEGPDSSLDRKKAYQKYERNTAVEVFRRGGNFFWIAAPVAVLTGESSHPLAQHWSQFVLVNWPSRMAFRHLVAASNFRKGVGFRNAGLESAIAIPGTPFPDFVRYSL
jgi:uncharacterized protein (DUF1330 family)